MSTSNPRKQLQFDLQRQIDSITGKPKLDGANARQVYSVGQLVRLVSQQLERQHSAVWVEGEVSNLRQPSSGHVYFTLKDRQAQLPVVLFRSMAQRLKFEIEDGQSLRCRGALTIYPAQGRFQLNAQQAEPVGLGALQLAFDQLKKRLASEGLFDARYKVPLPKTPQTIAIVTSSTGAALRDILEVLRTRWPIRVLVCPSAVQGPDAPYELCAALRQADTLDADLIIVGRGGGSLEDLWAFNNEGVARTLFALRTPIVSAVGHEIDLTIADLVADRRAPTPSAAAELATPDIREVRATRRQLTDRLTRAITDQQRRLRLELIQLSQRLGSPQSIVQRRRITFDELLLRAHHAIQKHVRNAKRRHDALQLALTGRRPDLQLGQLRVRLEKLDAQLHGQIRTHIHRYRRRYARLVTAIDALSPLGVLSRGYSLAEDVEGRVLHNAMNVAVGDPIRLRLHHGQLRCVVRSRSDTWDDNDHRTSLSDPQR